jgi:uncharacterized membrane protein HdeD (DUF308 family)
VDVEQRMVVREAARLWWVFLVAGVLWLLVGWVVLRLDIGSVATVGVLIGFVFLGAAVNEFLVAGQVAGAWKLVHYVVAGMFVLGALWGFFRPIDTFFALASVLGLILVLQGAFDITRAVVSKPENDLWWLGLASGLLHILLAMWVSQRQYPIAASAGILLLWVGFMAVFRGLGQIGLAFAVRSAGKGAASE